MDESTGSGRGIGVTRLASWAKPRSEEGYAITDRISYQTVLKKTAHQSFTPARLLGELAATLLEAMSLWRGEAVLDLVISNTLELIQGLTVVQSLSNSDHSRDGSNIQGGGRKPKSDTVTRNFRKGDFNKTKRTVKKGTKVKNKVKSLAVAWMLLKNQNPVISEGMCATEQNVNQAIKE